MSSIYNGGAPARSWRSNGINELVAFDCGLFALLPYGENKVMRAVACNISFGLRKIKFLAMGKSIMSCASMSCCCFTFFLVTTSLVPVSNSRQSFLGILQC